MGLNKHWFKPRKWGIGWAPTSWEGYLVIVLAVVALYFAFTAFTGNEMYLAILGIAVVLGGVSELKSNPRLIFK
jgi:hypothetical protein